MRNFKFLTKNINYNDYQGMVSLIRYLNKIDERYRLSYHNENVEVSPRIYNDIFGLIVNERIGSFGQIRDEYHIMVNTVGRVLGYPETEMIGYNIHLQMIEEVLDETLNR